jgi:hypothetical protein
MKELFQTERFMQMDRKQELLLWQSLHSWKIQSLHQHQHPQQHQHQCQRKLIYLEIEAAPGTMSPDNMAALEGLGSSAPAPGPTSVVQASGPSDPLALALYDSPSSKVQVQTMVLTWSVHVLILQHFYIHSDIFQIIFTFH